MAVLRFVLFMELPEFEMKKCPICNLVVADDLITEDGICDYCDSDRLDNKPDNNELDDNEPDPFEENWKKLPLSERNRIIKEVMDRHGPNRVDWRSP